MWQLRTYLTLLTFLFCSRILQLFTILAAKHFHDQLDQLQNFENKRNYTVNKKPTMEPSVIEFIGEKSTIGIVPNFSFDPLHLISGSVGPFRAGLPVHVPLWLGIHLRKQQKCRIVPPEWMDMELLEEIKEAEKKSKFFTKMPSEHFMVEAQLIMSTAPDDVPRCEELRTIIKDIFDIRESKLRTSIDVFIKGEGTYAKLDNLTLLEIHTVRPILPHSLDHIARYQRTALATQRDTSSLGLSNSMNTSHFSQ